MNHVEERIWMIDYIDMIKNEKKKSSKLEVTDVSKFQGKSYYQGGKENETRKEDK